MAKLLGVAAEYLWYLNIFWFVQTEISIWLKNTVDHLDASIYIKSTLLHLSKSWSYFHIS